MRIIREKFFFSEFRDGNFEAQSAVVVEFTDDISAEG